MKKFTSIIEQKKINIKRDESLDEANKYLEFAKKYHKKNGVSGPFDKKFQDDKEEQKKYLAGLSKAWAEFKDNQKKSSVDIKEELIHEANTYLDFCKKYHEKQGVSGPFDKKFKGDVKAQKKYMQELSNAWTEYKKENKIKPAKDLKSVNESKASDMAKDMINDGGDPNYHFVTMSDDYYYEKDEAKIKYSDDMESAPILIKTKPDMGVYTFGPFMNIEESKLFAESIELDGLNGPRMLKIEDRITGEVYTRYLTCKLQPVWNEDINLKKSDSDQEIENEDPTSEYTYGDEE